MLEAIVRFFRPKQRCFEATTASGNLVPYLIALRRGEGGERDKKLAARLRINGMKLERKRNGGKGNVLPMRRAV